MISPPVEQLLTSLAGKVCPACGDKKRERMTFCASCYYDLPKQLQAALYRRIGHGYEEAVDAAMADLDAEEFCMEAADGTA